MPEAVCRDGELDRDKGVPALGLLEADLRLLAGSANDSLVGLLADDALDEIVQDYPLVMPAHDPLGFAEIPVGHVIEHGIVESEKQRVQLRDDDVLVVPLVADERPAWLGGVARKVRPLLSRSIEVLVVA